MSGIRETLSRKMFLLTKLVIHCGACMINRRAMLSRQKKCAETGVSIVNYGVLISYLHGIMGPRHVADERQLKGKSPDFRALRTLDIEVDVCVF